MHYEVQWCILKLVAMYFLATTYLDVYLRMIKFIHHPVYIIHAKLILTGFEIANILFAWANIFRHKKWKRKVQPKTNFERETMTRDWI